ncbi:ATP-dependent DNA helicase [Rhodococcus sp. X156]|uniref:ATP-dependent DNA helicase n=1 Tax=Rhodococcus sp. X156 TaxID=2499145 RepID=UPI001F49E926|nr:ATP-dependent DNA helicase [Rhodococcus sp. X156]
MPDSPAPDSARLPAVPELLASAVQALGGAERTGQLSMASAVAHALEGGQHLAVQAGTGTGKSLAYLVPAIRHAVSSGKTVVVSTATIALQRQLVDRDLPRLAKALKPELGQAPQFAILKGRRNYLCLHRLDAGAPEDPDEALFDAFAVSKMGREVQRLHAWAEKTETGDRDEIVPGVSEQAWRQVSVSARECLGVARCPVGSDCFAEQARAAAAKVDVVVTNHALLAIDAITGIPVLPEHDAVVIDEAHELVDRVTAVATAELHGAAISAAARRCAKMIDDRDVDRLEASAEGFTMALEDVGPGRWERSLPDQAATALAAVRDAAWACRTAIGPVKPGMSAADPEAAAARTAALALIDEVHDTAVRVLVAFDQPDPAKRHDVVWLAAEERRGLVLKVAPLSVGGLLRKNLFDDSTVVLTSATLALGGSFDNLARQWGLPAENAARSDTGTASAKEAPSEGAASSTRWSSLDVGSPFAHATSGILYVAKHLPAPGRDGLVEAYLTEIEELVSAAGGRTLGLFSSMRAAKAAAEAMRERLDTPVLCQGEDSTGQLITKFAADEATSLFGTLSLWQGVDVPGRSLSLVILDRIPFPRPDDPLLVARQRAVESTGGNGFLTVAANHAALLLAQGVGRLLRSVDDRGVVAVLDPRLVTARYGGYLRASLPPFWQTTDPAVVRSALRRLVDNPEA